MDTKLCCSYCNTEIKDGGKIKNGKAYHNKCQENLITEEEKFTIAVGKLSYIFDVDPKTIEMLMAHDTEETIIKDLQSPFCYIAKEDVGTDTEEVWSSGFNNESKMLSEIRATLVELRDQAHLSILYYMRDGKIIKKDPKIKTGEIKLVD